MNIRPAPLYFVPIDLQDLYLEMLPTAARAEGLLRQIRATANEVSQHDADVLWLTESWRGQEGHLKQGVFDPSTPEGQARHPMSREAFIEKAGLTRLNPHPEDQLFVKYCRDGFHETHLRHVLFDAKAHTLLFAGLLTSACVPATTLTAAMGFKCVVLTDLMGDQYEKPTQAGLNPRLKWHAFVYEMSRKEHKDAAWHEEMFRATNPEEFERVKHNIEFTSSTEALRRLRQGIPVFAAGSGR